jgi:dihydroflavonol-4-reductase
MKVCVTGATGFIGAHLAARLVAAGHDVKVAVRDRSRLRALEGVEVDAVEANVLDRRSLGRAMAGCEILFHCAGMVASQPRSEVWRVNAVAPRVAVDAAARRRLRRVVLTSSVAAIGPAAAGRPANEQNSYPAGGTGLLYTDSKREGEVAAFEAGDRLGIEVVAVNPAYVLGAALNRSLPGETSTRIVGNYLRGRLPAIVDSYTNIVDVEDVAKGHLLAAEKGRPGERYILGGENLRWSAAMEEVAELSGVHHPLLVLPPEIASAADLLKRLGVPFGTLEGIRLMAP